MSSRRALSEPADIPSDPHRRLAFLVVIAVIVAGRAERVTADPGAVTPFPEPLQSATPTSVWFGLLQSTPYPYSTSLPEAVWSPMDATYAEVDPNPPQWWACRRCADYRHAGGVWKMSFDRGIMRIFYEIPLCRSMASFEVAGDRLFLFNDTTCPQEVGEYSWALEDRNLVLSAIDDPCAFGLRAENLTLQPWASCMPPKEMVAASDHWHKPPGCEPDLEPDPVLMSNEQGLTIRAIGAIARELEVPPKVVAAGGVAGNQPSASHDRIGRFRGGASR